MGTNQNIKHEIQIMEWKSVGERSTGTKHLAVNQDCQDYVSHTTLRNNQQVLIGAVSDGAGSARYSQVGSRLAVETSIVELQRLVWNQVPIQQEQAEEIFRNLLNEVISEFQRQAEIDGCSIHDLACTLLVFFASPDWLVAMQIGDGMIVVRHQESDYQLLFAPDKGEYINETSFVTTPNVKVQVCVRPVCQGFICAATDGIENISLIKQGGWIPSTKFFEPLEKHIRSSISQEQKQAELHRFLNSTKLNQATDDDKTLLLCFYEYTSGAKKPSSAQLSHAELPNVPSPQVQMPLSHHLEHQSSNQLAVLNYASKQKERTVAKSKNNWRQNQFRLDRFFRKNYLKLLIIGILTTTLVLIASFKIPLPPGLFNPNHSDNFSTIQTDSNLIRKDKVKILQIAPDAKIQISATLRQNEIHNYYISAKAGQRLITSLRGDGILVMRSPDNEILPNQEVQKQKQAWQGSLPKDGEYFIQIKNENKASPRDYKYRLKIILRDGL